MSKTPTKGNKAEAIPTTIRMNRRTGEFALTLSLLIINPLLMLPNKLLLVDSSAIQSC